MKTIYRLSIYSSLLMLAACATVETPELEAPEITEPARIIVFGGSSSSAASRAVDTEPSNIGTCNADQLKILAFRGTHTGAAVVPADLKEHTDTVIGLDKQLNYRDKWTTDTASLNFKNLTNTGFAFPSIAYSSKDDGKFNIEYGTSYEKLGLKVDAASYTPELYFGRLKPNPSISFKDNSVKNGIVYDYSTLNDSKNYTLEGKLYRIVSQLNINLTEVSSSVKKIEMYLSNVPTEIGLYAEHRTELGNSGSDRGFFYPIVEAKGDNQHSKTETLVCSVTDFSDGNAKLSTFILPSNLGRTVTLKAYITNPDNPDSPIERVRALRASKDYFLDEATSEVYFSSTPLQVYNAANWEFTSYPNVRVNVKGKLSDIFAEETDANVVIEICPNYDGEHTIPIN